MEIFMFETLNVGMSLSQLNETGYKDHLQKKYKTMKSLIGDFNIANEMEVLVMHATLMYII